MFDRFGLLCKYRIDLCIYITLIFEINLTLPFSAFWGNCEKVVHATAPGGAESTRWVWCFTKLKWYMGVSSLKQTQMWYSVYLIKIIVVATPYGVQYWQVCNHRYCGLCSSVSNILDKVIPQNTYRKGFQTNDITPWGRKSQKTTNFLETIGTLQLGGALWKHMDLEMWYPVYPLWCSIRLREVTYINI